MICRNGILRLYSAVRERKSIEFSYGAYFSKNRGIEDREKNCDDSINQIPA